MTSRCAAECEEVRLEAAALGSTPEDTPSLSWSVTEQLAMRLALSRAMRAVLIEVRVRVRVMVIVRVRVRVRVRVSVRVNHILPLPLTLTRGASRPPRCRRRAWHTWPRRAPS
jgi:hypothetical protein